jgi:hypothetical protein
MIVAGFGGLLSGLFIVGAVGYLVGVNTGGPESPNVTSGPSSTGVSQAQQAGPAGDPPRSSGGPQPAPTATSLVSSHNEKCLAAVSASDGQPVVLTTCDGSGLQAWDQRKDGTIVVMGNLCLDLPWGATVDGTTLQIAFCNGAGAQRFETTQSQQLRSLHANKCLEPVGGSPGDGVKIAISPCSDTVKQRWHGK